MKDRRVGLFGGTFDPPHFGHVAALEAAARTGRFSRLIVTVAGDPYFKNDDVHPAWRRLAMAHAAFDDVALVEVSDVEVRREGPSYSIETVREVLRDADAVDLLVGADLATQLDHWHEADQLRELVDVGIVPRPGAQSAAPEGWRWYEIPMTPVDLSSTFVRHLPTTTSDLEKFLPPGVIPLFEEARG
ncbi:MAG: putative nicotinate-nucleotide adenylyltransferase ((+) pyrophosphorylase) [Acidimicrobiaceae bacterium]|nr:putative nicotinate-nucleotide adenylyltransferase ((+) pyrophosphorylase) [Acidimicrobiaceae bacterium]